MRSDGAIDDADDDGPPELMAGHKSLDHSIVKHDKQQRSFKFSTSCNPLDLSLVELFSVMLIHWDLSQSGMFFLEAPEIRGNNLVH